MDFEIIGFEVVEECEIVDECEVVEECTFFVECVVAFAVDVVDFEIIK